MNVNVHLQINLCGFEGKKKIVEVVRKLGEITRVWGGENDPSEEWKENVLTGESNCSYCRG